MSSPRSAQTGPSERRELPGLRDDHATVAGLHAFADLPQPVSLLLCDALIEWALVSPVEPPPRPPAPHLNLEQVLTGIAARLAETVPARPDTATKLAVGRVARHLGLADRALRDASTPEP